MCILMEAGERKGGVRRMLHYAICYTNFVPLIEVEQWLMIIVDSLQVCANKAATTQSEKGEEMPIITAFYFSPIISQNAESVFKARLTPRQNRTCVITSSHDDLQ